MIEKLIRNDSHSTIEYISKMLIELECLAGETEYHTLSYLIGMAQLESEEMLNNQISIITGADANVASVG